MKISSLLTNASIATGLASAAIISAPMASSAATFNFANIAGADTVGDSLAPFLSFDVDAGSSGGTLFTFKFDAASPTGFIRTVYIDSAVGTTLLGTNITIQDTPPSVDFNGGVGSNNLPQGNNLTPNFTTDYAFNRETGDGNSKAIQPGESLKVLFSNANFNSVLSAIEGGSLRVGYHVQGITIPGVVTGGSDSYVNTPGTSRPVPVPGFLLGVVAAGAVGGSRLLKSKKQVA